MTRRGTACNGGRRREREREETEKEKEREREREREREGERERGYNIFSSFPKKLQWNGHNSWFLYPV